MVVNIYLEYIRDNKNVTNMKEKLRGMGNLLIYFFRLVHVYLI